MVIVTMKDLQNFLKDRGLHKFNIDVNPEYPGHLDIYIDHYWFSTKNLVKKLKPLIPVTVGVCLEKPTFMQWLKNTIKGCGKKYENFNK
jgi:hypothetical protein